MEFPIGKGGHARVALEVSSLVRAEDQYYMVGFFESLQEHLCVELARRPDTHTNRRLDVFQRDGANDEELELGRGHGWWLQPRQPRVLLLTVELWASRTHEATGACRIRGLATLRAACRIEANRLSKVCDLVDNPADHVYLLMCHCLSFNTGFDHNVKRFPRIAACCRHRSFAITDTSQLQSATCLLHHVADVRSASAEHRIVGRTLPFFVSGARKAREGHRYLYGLRSAKLNDRESRAPRRFQRRSIARVSHLRIAVRVGAIGASRALGASELFEARACFVSFGTPVKLIDLGCRWRTLTPTQPKTAALDLRAVVDLDRFQSRTGFVELRKTETARPAIVGQRGKAERLQSRC
mmetsp:Transcript_27252/g.71798  ORF Transcript_27252/g.71798 Transcript_27252/m.71798 type:complete len:354 (+) Transcript_27252:1186-2247(+)